LIEAAQTFGVANEEISAGLEAAGEAVDQRFLSGPVELNHDVAAEDEREASVRQRFHQVEAPELDRGAEMFLYEIPILPLTFAAEDIAPQLLG
jgi:hypothetical protein